jgi:magnesium transporter
VVTADNKLVGVVNVGMFAEITGSVFDVSEKEHVNDVFQHMGFRVTELKNASPFKAFKLRVPWLMATLGAGVCCAMISGMYEKTLAASLILAFFLALVLGLSESVSAQSVTVTVEALHGRRADRKWLKTAIRKEFATALMLGGTCGAIVCVVSWLWRGNAMAAFVIGGSIAVSMIVACLIGLMVPSLLQRFKLDPRIAAGPVSLALADVFTLLVYLNLAAFVL